MGEVSYYEVWQDEALEYNSRGVKFLKGKVVKVVNEDDIKAFATDGVLQIRAVPVVRKKAAPKAEPEPETTKPEITKSKATSTEKKPSTSKAKKKKKKG